MDRQLISIVLFLFSFVNDEIKWSSLISIGNEFQIMKKKFL